MRICVIQSCYIPWKGFFDLIGQCDLYVVLDRAQFVKRHWHNRNRIKTANGLEWLTIPVVTKGRFDQPIDEVEIAEDWTTRHWRTIEMAYGGAPFFRELRDTVWSWYEKAGRERLLTNVNLIFLREIAARLDLKTKIVLDRDFAVEGRRTERLVAIARAAGASEYLSGPSARAYLDETLFAQAGIGVRWMSYDGYPAYPQRHGVFEHAVSALDLLFHTGPEAPRYARKALA